MSQVASTLPPILCIPLFIGVADAFGMDKIGIQYRQAMHMRAV